jgi:hypothetical protein
MISNLGAGHYTYVLPLNEGGRFNLIFIYGDVNDDEDDDHDHDHDYNDDVDDGGDKKVLWKGTDRQKDREKFT